MLKPPKSGQKIKPVLDPRDALQGFILSMDVFKKLPPAQLAEVEKKLAEKKFPKGASIYLEGDPAEYVWFVKEGHVKGIVYTPNGRTLTLCMVGSQGMFGGCCCFGSSNYPCNGVAESDTVVYSYPMADFLALLDKNPEMSRVILENVSKRLRRSKDTKAFEQESVQKRILHVLVNMVEEFGNTIPLTRREIAEMAGTTVETCIRIFSILENESVVSTVRGKIFVPNVQVLLDRLDEI